MKKKLPFTYGEKVLELRFPDGFLAGDLVKPNPPDEILTRAGMVKKIDSALARPDGTKRLRDMVKGKRVGFVISDEFRWGLQELIAERMMVEIFAGDPKSLTVFIATGTHDAGIYGKNMIQVVKTIAEKIGRPVKVMANDCDSGAHVFLGETALGTPAEVWDEWLKTEVRVSGHESKHHYMNGYSVTDKHVCPGLSSRRTVKSTHKHALNHEYSAAGRNPHHNDVSRRKNPFGEDNRYVRKMANRHLIIDGELKDVGYVPEFLLDMISSSKSIDWIKAGEPDIVSREMTAAADKHAAHNLEKTKYVVISPGGPPACNSLYGVQNCFDMALKYAIKQGGEALILAPCAGRPELEEEVSGLAPDLKAKLLFWDNLVKWIKRPLEEGKRWIEDNFELYLWKTDRILKLQLEQEVKLYLYSDLPDEKVIPGGFIPVKDPDAWISERASRNDGKIRAIDEGNKLLVIPR